MFNRIAAYLRQPYPFNADTKNYLKVITVFGVFVAAFLLIFQPYGINQMPVVDRLKISLSFGAITFVSLLLFLALTKIFPRWFNDDHWTLGKEITFSAFNFFAVGNGNYLFVRYGWYKEYMEFDYGGMMFATFTVGFFPYLFMLLTDHMRRLNRNLGEAAQLTQDLKHVETTSKDAVTLKGENEGDTLTVLPDHVYLISSSGNYIEVWYQANQHKLSKEVLRSTLSAVEEELAHYPNFFRCHRTHLVNLNQIGRISGNSQGYRLHFTGMEQDIPVARTKNSAFKSSLERLSMQVS